MSDRTQNICRETGNAHWLSYKSHWKNQAIKKNVKYPLEANKILLKCVFSKFGKKAIVFFTHSTYIFITMLLLLIRI